MDSASRFWQETSRYHDLAEQFERNVETRHPERVSSRGMCVCLDYCNWCGWAGTKVAYYEYQGPKI